MSGISRIQATRDRVGERRGGGNTSPGKEIWFKDGDQAFVSSLATGDVGDQYLDEVYLFTYNAGGRWTNLVDDPAVDTSDVPSGTRSSHKFAFWGYVHEIIHLEKKVDEWEEIQGPGGRKMYKETVNDFRIISLSFGRSDYIWNQLVDVYNDWNGLNKGVMRIKRAGSGQFDTSYQIAGTARKDEIPEDRKADIADLPPIKQYFLTRYGNTSTESEGVSLAEPALVTTSVSADDLF